jgi:hypothetical protein
VAMGRYEYEGFKLTPTIAAELAPSLCEGQTLKGSDVFRMAYDHHTRLGGLPMEGTRSSCQQDTMAHIRKKNLAKRNGHSYLFPKLGQPLPNSSPPSSPKTHEIQKSSEVVPIKSVGTGSESVYAYFYPTYKEISELKGQTFWPIKIGRTDVGLSRVQEQSRTSLPEHPIIAIEIRTYDSRSLECAIHSHLKYAGRRIDDAPGSEWYMTSPQEIEYIYNALNRISSDRISGA